MKDDYILIVDDELPIREMIHTSLDMAGFQCQQAEDAKQAHQMIVDQRPVLILLDWMMPGGVCVCVCVLCAEFGVEPQAHFEDIEPD